VSVGAFKSNLKEMIRLSRAAGATVVLITAPSERRLTPGAPWFKTRGIDEFDDHEKYVVAVREVARDTNTGLVDFAHEIERLRTDFSGEYFIDFVHPNAKGQQLLAGLLRPWVDCAMSKSCPR